MALPANPLSGTLTGKRAAGLPPNPLSGTLTGKPGAPPPAAVAHQHGEPFHPVVPAAVIKKLANRIVSEKGITSEFGQHLAALQSHDPTFQSRLNAMTKELSAQAEARNNSGVLGIAGKAITGAANPLEWVKGAVEGAPQVAHGVEKMAHGNVSGGAAQAGLGSLGVLGVVPGVGRVGEALGIAAKVGRSEAQADAHIAEAVQNALAEGKGAAYTGGLHNAPRVGRNITPEEHAALGGAGGQAVRDALAGRPSTEGLGTYGKVGAKLDTTSAAKAGKAQQDLAHESRVAQTARAQAAHEAAGGGLAGHAAALEAARGAHAKVPFPNAVQHVDESTFHALVQHVDNAPALKFWESRNAVDALQALREGRLPPPYQQNLLKRVFGAESAGVLKGGGGNLSTWDKIVHVLNIPRAVRSSMDISYGFRQGLLLLATHPKLFAKTFARQIKMFGSERAYQEAMAEIHSDPLYPLMDKYGLPLTDIGTKVAKTEEAYVGSQAAEHIPIVGRIIRASDRAFTGFANLGRAEMFKMLVKKAALLGEDLNDEHLGESIARLVGTFTGRGTVPKQFAGHLTTLNALMFSPRLLASRLNMLSPVFYKRLSPFARAEAFAGARNLVAAIGTVMFVARACGAQVTFDPRSSNFAKIKVGNTRIDIAGGFSQEVRLVAQEMAREEITGTGKHVAISGFGKKAGTGQISTFTHLTQFGRGKLGPVPGTFVDEASGQNFIGQPLSQTSELGQNAPFVSQDVYSAWKNSGALSVPAAAFLSAIGFGVQSYKDRPPSGGGTPAYGGDTGLGYGNLGYGNSGGGSYGGSDYGG